MTTRAFKDKEAKAFVEAISEAQLVMTPGLGDLVITVERDDGSTASGAIVATDDPDNPDHLTLLVSGPPENRHEDVRWDSITKICLQVSTL